MLQRITPPSARVSWAVVATAVVLFTIAFGARLSVTLRGSGLFGLNNYDDGVHFAAALGLVHGRLPYRDFLLLQPPGIVVALAPFAELTRWIGDARGFAAARLAFMVLGAGNALLVARFLRPVGRFAALVGGLFYALFWPAIYSEHTVLLEGLANTCLLVALLLIVPRTRGTVPTTRILLAAGAVLGFAATIKIWGVLPVLVVVGWLAVRFGLPRAAAFFVGAVGSVTLVCLPFFVAAPVTMWRMVVLDQLQRNDTGGRLIERVHGISGMSLYHEPDHVTLSMVLVSLVLVGATLAAWSVPRAHPAVLLVVSLVGLLLLTPSWFTHYTAYSAAVLAIAVGASGQRLVDRASAPGGSRWRGRATAMALAAGWLLVSLPMLTAQSGNAFPGASLGAAAGSRPGCVTSDHPSALILMNVLSRNLDRGCPLVVDLGGASYHLDSPNRGVSTRQGNEVFQQYALTYLRTGDSTVIARFRKSFGLSPASYQIVQSWPTVTSAGRYRVSSPQPESAGR